MGTFNWPLNGENVTKTIIKKYNNQYDTNYYKVIFSNTDGEKITQTYNTRDAAEAATYTDAYEVIMSGNYIINFN